MEKLAHGTKTAFIKVNHNNYTYVFYFKVIINSTALIFVLWIKKKLWNITKFSFSVLSIANTCLLSRDAHQEPFQPVWTLGSCPVRWAGREGDIQVRLCWPYPDLHTQNTTTLTGCSMHEQADTQLIANAFWTVEIMILNGIRFWSRKEKEKHFVSKDLFLSFRGQNREQM